MRSWATRAWKRRQELERRMSDVGQGRDGGKPRWKARVGTGWAEAAGRLDGARSWEWGTAIGTVWAQRQQPRFEGKAHRLDARALRDTRSKEDPSWHPSLSSSSLSGPRCLLQWYPTHTPAQGHVQPRHRSDAATTSKPIPKGEGWSRSRGCFWPTRPGGKDPRALQTAEHQRKRGDCPMSPPPPDLPAPLSPLLGAKPTPKEFSS